MNSRTRQRIILRMLAGNACQVCDSMGSLHWHHFFPETKLGNVSSLYGMKAVQEARKCMLLCAPCHRAIHGNRLSLTTAGIYIPLLPENEG